MFELAFLEGDNGKTDFMALANEFLPVKSNRRFVALFGLPADTADELWGYVMSHVGIGDDSMSGVREKHFLWALNFLKLYPTESSAAAMWDVDEKTYRKRVWKMVEIIANLDLVSG